MLILPPRGPQSNGGLPHFTGKGAGVMVSATCNRDAEQFVLGCLMRHGDVADFVMDAIRVDEFHVVQHRYIFSAIAFLIEDVRPGAGALLAFLESCPRLWTELASAGFDRQASLEAVGELAGQGYQLLVTVEGVRLAGGRGA